MNVALTRAKHKLIMVGSASTLAAIPLYSKMLEMMRERQSLFQVPKTVMDAFNIVTECSRMSPLKSPIRDVEHVTKKILTRNPILENIINQ